MKRVLFFMALALPLIGSVSLASDFNGDGTGDIAIFRASSGLWSVRGITRVYFGSTGDTPVPADYDGSGTDIIGIFRQSSGLWAARDLSRVYFGRTGDLPVPGDYEGDGTCEPGIFRSSSGLWAVIGTTRFYYGTSGDIAISPGKAARECHLLVTGQFTEYSSGDDGTYQAGIAFSYQTDDPAGNGDIVTIDNVTGLMWASDGDEKGCNFGNDTDWYLAIEYCNNLTFANYSDWRLPNRRKLESLVNAEMYSPAIDTTYFPNAKTGDYWSSTTYYLNTTWAWYMYCKNGSIHFDLKSTPKNIRAVRGGL